MGQHAKPGQLGVCQLHVARCTLHPSPGMPAGVVPGDPGGMLARMAPGRHSGGPPVSGTPVFFTKNDDFQRFLEAPYTRVYDFGHPRGGFLFILRSLGC